MKDGDWVTRPRVLNGLRVQDARPALKVWETAGIDAVPQRRCWRPLVDLHHLNRQLALRRRRGAGGTVRADAGWSRDPVCQDAAAQPGRWTPNGRPHEDRLDRLT